MYTESLDVLEHHIKPLRRVPGVVLEQAYLNKMAEGLKPLEILAYSRSKYWTTQFNLEQVPSYSTWIFSFFDLFAFDFCRFVLFS